MPVNSSPRTLSIARYAGYNTELTITLRHYVDDIHLSDYVLILERGVQRHEPQRYRLPNLREGTVEVIFEIEGEKPDAVMMTYSANELYKKGLLIYLTDNDSEYVFVDGDYNNDSYVFFVSGKNEICNYKQPFSSEWITITDAPQRKRFLGEPLPTGWNSGWEENEWTVVPAQ